MSLLSAPKPFVLPACLLLAAPLAAQDGRVSNRSGQTLTLEPAPGAPWAPAIPLLVTPRDGSGRFLLGPGGRKDLKLDPNQTLYLQFAFLGQKPCTQDVLVSALLPDREDPESKLRVTHRMSLLTYRSGGRWSYSWVPYGLKTDEAEVLETLFRIVPDGDGGVTVHDRDAPVSERVSLPAPSLERKAPASGGTGSGKSKPVPFRPELPDARPDEPEAFELLSTSDLLEATPGPAQALDPILRSRSPAPERVEEKR